MREAGKLDDEASSFEQVQEQICYLLRGRKLQKQQVGRDLWFWTPLSVWSPSSDAEQLAAFMSLQFRKEAWAEVNTGELSGWGFHLMPWDSIKGWLWQTRMNPSWGIRALRGQKQRSNQEGKLGTVKDKNKQINNPPHKTKLAWPGGTCL